MGGEFFGICVYCDEIFLLSASRAGLQSLMDECQSFAANNNLQFSVNSCPIKSKSKCIIFAKNVVDRTGVDPILLNGVALPWVSKLRHLGPPRQQRPYLFHYDVELMLTAISKRVIVHVPILRRSTHILHKHVSFEYISFIITLHTTNFIQ